MSFKVGELMTPNSVGDMGQQNKTAVDIDGGTIGGASLFLRVFPTSSLLVGSHAAGQLVYCSDGDAGDPCLAVYDGSSFKRIVLGATVSAT
jgi:hypothetical protein